MLLLPHFQQIAVRPREGDLNQFYTKFAVKSFLEWLISVNCVGRAGGGFFKRSTNIENAVSGVQLSIYNCLDGLENIRKLICRNREPIIMLSFSMLTFEQVHC